MHDDDVVECYEMEADGKSFSLVAPHPDNAAATAACSDFANAEVTDAAADDIQYNPEIWDFLSTENAPESESADHDSNVSSNPFVLSTSHISLVESVNAI